jgi:hypothetical protein
MNAAEAMRQCLSEGEALVAMLDDVTYRRRLPAAMDASVGGHYRHALDHFRNLLEADDTGVVDYDRRFRGTAIELDCTAALAETRRLAGLLEDLPPDWPDRALGVRTLAIRGGNAADETRSTAGREAVYCVMHAVHHYALIRIICGLQGCELPATFGVAPSTVAAHAGGPALVAS